MARLYVNQTLEKQVRQYCEANGIEDVNAFANRCLQQGFSILKFGTSPRDNAKREEQGVKDFDKKPIKTVEEKKEPSEAKKVGVIRKIQIVKKQ